MSLFNITIKTKNGNDIKKKETFTLFFRLNYKTTILKKVTAEYTYRIMYSSGVDDPRKVLVLKNQDKIKSANDLMLKVMLNLCHIVGVLTTKLSIDPDFMLFLSPDFENKHSNAWKFIKDAFDTEISDDEFDQKWQRKGCQKFGIVYEDLQMLRGFRVLNPNTVFMNIDPGRDPKKYAKSIVICNQLQDRLNRQLQIAV